jgi:hypothetical protein
LARVFVPKTAAKTAESRNNADIVTNTNQSIEKDGKNHPKCS